MKTHSPNGRPHHLVILVWNMQVGGLQKSIKDICLDMAAHQPNWQIHLLVKRQTPSHFLDEIQAKTNVKLYCFTKSYRRSKSIGSIFWLGKLLLTIKPDVCLTFLDHLSLMLIGFNSLFFWQRFKLVLNEGVITSAYLSLNRAHTSLWQWLIRIFYRLADVIIVPTRACRKDLVDHFRLPKNKITVIPYWTLFKPLAPARKRYDLLYAGRFEKEKNIPDILSLAKVLKPAFPRLRVCLIGEGKLKSVIQNQVVTQGLADTVSLLSPTAHVARFLSRSKVLVLPTLNEGMPNIILEAAMCQVPTVSYRYPGVEEVILDRKTGYITQGIEETATKLNRLLTKPKLLNRLGKNAQRFVQAHAAQAQQQRFIDVLIST